MTKQEYLDYVNQQFDELEKYLSDLFEDVPED